MIDPAKLASMWDHLGRTTKGATSQKRNPDGSFVSQTSEWSLAWKDYQAALGGDPPPPPSYNPRTIWLRKPWAPDAKAATVDPNSAAMIANWVAQGWVYPNMPTNDASYATAWTIGDAAKDPLYALTAAYSWGWHFDAQIPIPLGTKVGSGDGHLTVFELARNRVHDFWQARFDGTKWTCSSGYSYDAADDANAGANAANFPQMALPVWPEEIAEGVIKHALAFSVLKAAPGVYRYPARHTDGSGGSSNLPEGVWLRMPQSVAVDSTWPNFAKIVFKALQEHGMFCMDQGGTLAIGSVCPLNGGLKWSDVGVGNATQGVIGFPSNFPWGKMEVLAPPA